jgi:uncharacterized protein (DUF924 family)
MAAKHADEILSFWFGKLPASQFRDKWFKKNDQFDTEIKARYFSTYEKAAKGELESWSTQPEECLALVILLDQFPRNMFRHTERAFATDKLALKYAKSAVAQGFDHRVGSIERMFFYLPFEHSENLADQNEAVNLFAALTAARPEVKTTLDYAIEHREIIQKFGRFPHRNKILNRASTPEELKFLESFRGF